MLNQLLRFTLVSSALLWLRPRWRGLLALTVSVLLIHVLHGEYLGYVELSGDRSFLVWSYVVKWVGLIVAVAIYVLLAVYGMKPGARSRTPAAPVNTKRPVEPAAGKTASAPNAQDDGFDFLRQKKRLENRADKVIAAHRRSR